MDKNNPEKSVSRSRVTPIKIDSIYIDFRCYRKQQDGGSSHNHSPNRNTSVELSKSANDSADNKENSRKNPGDFNMRKYVAQKIRQQYAERSELLALEPNSNEAPANMDESPNTNEAPAIMDESPNTNEAPASMDESPNINEAPVNMEESPNTNEAPVNMDESPNMNEAPVNMDESLTCTNKLGTANPSSIHNTIVTTGQLGVDEENQQMEKNTLEDPKDALSLSEGLGHVHIREENPVATEVRNAYPAFTANWAVWKRKRSRRKRRKLRLVSDIYQKTKPIGDRPTTTFQVVNVIEDFKLEQEEECSSICIRRRKHAKKAIDINEDVQERNKHQ